MLIKNLREECFNLSTRFIMCFTAFCQHPQKLLEAFAQKCNLKCNNLVIIISSNSKSLFSATTKNLQITSILSNFAKTENWSINILNWIFVKFVQVHIIIKIVFCSLTYFLCYTLKGNILTMYKYLSNFSNFSFLRLHLGVKIIEEELFILLKSLLKLSHYTCLTLHLKKNKWNHVTTVVNKEL